MASTYVNNLRLEEMANGENSGTWGTKTNVNLELIGQSTAFGTRAIADASTDNITIGDGVADADRCLGLKLTGGGQACTVTLLPNTSSKTWFMYNATSYTLTFTCGSGANVAIPAGQTKVIATDGLGGGGVVHDLLTAVSTAGDLNVAGDIITASTLQATGDTAAGDDAAIGYTAAEGLILTGQGSTNDVTIKNDADADVLEIPTGTVNVDVVGDITAGATLNAAGDTAAGDDAAIGYTTAEGLILTGQGSTNDVTIKNDADADVIEIPTGTVNVTFAGDITLAGDVTTASNADVDINPNGTGNVVLKTDLVSVGGGSEVGHVSSNGSQDMKISSNSGTNSGTIIITDAANGAITLAPNGTGIVDVQGSMNSSISTTGKSLVFGF